MFIEAKLNYDYLKINDSIEYYGGTQEWYNSYWKRMAGCGPITASTIIMYEKKKNNLVVNYSKSDFIELMEELWNYVTPRTMGLNKIEYYAEGFDKFIKDNNNISLSVSNSLPIPRAKFARPTKNEVFVFLEDAIERNHPVAFLNLHHGKEIKIESWHWVTLVGVMLDEDKDILNAIVADGGILKNINLGLWLETSTEGGGFIYYL